MGKIVWFLYFSVMYVFAEVQSGGTGKELQDACLKCHKKEQIPDSLIYHRYLMRYSTSSRMEKAIFNYLKMPDKTDSIMPSQFFLKFPMKKKSDMDDETLKRNIRYYLEKYDIRKRLVLP